MKYLTIGAILAAAMFVLIAGATLTAAPIKVQATEQCSEGHYTVQGIKDAAKDVEAVLIKHWAGDEIFWLRKQLVLEGAAPEGVAVIDEMLVYYVPTVPTKVAIFLFNKGCSFQSFLLDTEVYDRTVKAIERMRVENRT